MSAEYNFAAASTRDRIVHGAGRPKSWNGSGPVSSELVEDWAGFLKGKGIRRVVCLLDEDQLDLYAAPFLQQLRGHFSEVVHVPLADFGIPEAESLQRVVDALRDAEEADEPVVVHCSAGMGRTGTALAAWLVARYGLAPGDAVEEVVAHAKRLGAWRVPFEAGIQVLDVLGQL